MAKATFDKHCVLCPEMIRAGEEIRPFRHGVVHEKCMTGGWTKPEIDKQKIKGRRQKGRKFR